MILYIGTKVIKAKPMTRLAYNQFRGWDLPANENGEDEGYLVEYTDGGKPNVEGYVGYVSWSPKEQFENAYRETTGLSFGLALEAIKKGKKVARYGWNANGEWITLIMSIHDPVSPGQKFPIYRLSLIEESPGATAIPWLGIKTNNNKFVPWTPSQSDMLADDWFCLD